MYLHDLTWTEVRDLLPEIKMAIIPIGSTEQHGPHGCFDYDAAGSREFSKRLAMRLFPQVLVAPGIQIGVSGHHIHFPGSITLRPNTLVDVIMDVAWSLRQHGIRKFFLANGHGGNIPAMVMAANRLKQECGDRVAWATVPYDAVPDVSAKHEKTEINGHSCEIETSCMLYMWPQSVRTDRLTKGEIQPEMVMARERGRAIAGEARYFDEVTANGAMGDARFATVEIGREMVEVALDRYVEYLTEWMAR
jgi:creatinine amidohydrolase